MHGRRVRSVHANTARRWAPVWLPILGLFVSMSGQAQTDLGPVTVGAGLRTSFINTNPDGGNIWRATAWEIHPITAIEVLPKKPPVAP